MTISDLPALNATLNATCAVLLTIGYVLIRRGRVAQHRRVMIAAFTTSTLFLISYLVYHYNIGSKPFPGTGAIRTVYLTILVSHILLAIAIVPMALITLSRGLRERFDRHVAIARWTLPLWLYISITGVVVYVMLYRICPDAGPTAVGGSAVACAAVDETSYPRRLRRWGNQRYSGYWLRIKRQRLSAAAQEAATAAGSSPARMRAMLSLEPSRRTLASRSNWRP